MANNVGTAYVTVMPSMNGFASELTGEMSSAFSSASTVATAAGSDSAAGFSSGLSAKMGAIAGVVSSVASKAFDVIASSLDGAISRVDTLNNYPVVMEAIGYSSEEAAASIEALSDGIDGLPTSLDSIVSMTQSLAPMCDSLDEASQLAIALNDAMLAGGQGTEVANAAITQFTQMLAAGKVDMDAWNSVVTAAPGQMDQLAKSMLGATANQKDLYNALSDGTISMDEFCDAIVELDQSGGEGFSSFAEQAKASTQGIATSMENASTAVTKNLANIIDAFNQNGEISGLFDDIKGAINDVGSWIVDNAVPAIQDLIANLDEIEPVVASAVGAFAAFESVRGVQSLVSQLGDVGSALKVAADASEGSTTSITALASACSKLGDTGVEGIVKKLASGLSSLISPATLVAVGIAAVVAVVANLAAQAKEAAEHEELLGEATRDASDIMASAKGNVGDLSDAIGDLSVDAEETLQSLADLNAEVEETLTANYTDSGLLDQYVSTIQELANQSGLTATEQYQLTEAVRGFNEICGTSYSVVDATNGKIADENGTIQENTDQLIANAEAWKTRAEAESYSNIATKYLQEQMEAEYDLSVAQDQLTAAQDNYNQVYNKTVQNLKDMGFSDAQARQWASIANAVREASDALDEAQQNYDDLSASVDAAGDSYEYFSERAAIASAGLDEATTEAAQNMLGVFDNFADTATTALDSAGVSASDLSIKLAEAGVSTETLNSVGTAGIRNLANVFGDSIDSMVWAIENYNNTPVTDKDGNVTIDDAQLIDAQGNVYTWNGSTLVDQNGNAIVDDTKLLDAQGHLYTWNNSTLKNQSATVSVDTSSLARAQEMLNTWNRTAARSKAAGVTLTTSAALYAEGGIRKHEDGGVRYHASGGAIATKAVPLDIVGENGAEAIVPLTNRKYSQPFADIIAESVAGRLGGYTPTVVNVTVDGVGTSARVQQITLDLLDQLEKEARL